MDSEQRHETNFHPTPVYVAVTLTAQATEIARLRSVQAALEARATETADAAIGMFLEYRDTHGVTDEEDARRRAVLEITEGTTAIGVCSIGDAELAAEARRQLDDANRRLAIAAEHLTACDPPDVWNGYDQCPNHTSTWPCPETIAAWLIRGLDVDVTRSATLRRRRPAPVEQDEE